MMPTLFAAAAFLAAAVGFVWQLRARAGRRKAVLDAYAEREIARQRGDGPVPSLRRRARRPTEGARPLVRGSISPTK
jgi:hypothetical protein